MAKKKATPATTEPLDWPGHGEHVKQFHKTRFGTIYHGDSLLLLNRRMKPESVDLIVTSPPFGLVRKKSTATLTPMNTLSGSSPSAQPSGGS